MTFKTIEQELKPILEEYDDARADDMTLYEVYVKGKGLALSDVFRDRRYRISNNVPPYESISRIRRKLQAAFPELRPSKEYLKERKEAEKRYKDYAKTICSI